MQQQIQRVLTLVLYGAAGIGALWLAARYLLPWAAPFLLALGLAALLEPAVRFLIRRGWPRGAAAGLLTLTVLGGLIWAAAALVGRCLGVVTAFARQTPSLMQGLGRSLDLLEERALAAIAAAPEGTADYLQTALDAMGEVLYDLPALLSQWALDVAGRMAAASPNVLLFAVTAGIGTYFFSAGFPSALAFLEAQIPLDWKQRLAGLGQDLKGSFSGFCRAQLILMAMTFFELLLAFLLLGIRGVVGLAAVTAVVDALPVFGTGTVLIPWALYSLLLGSFGRGLGLLITWGVVNLVRSCVQAKLLGDQIGLDPIASLISIYVGWQVWGVWGMLLFPLLLVTLRQLNDKGVVHLWKSI